jgi:DNA-binding phage protein
MSRSRKTAFDKYREHKMNDDEFSKEYLKARSEIEAIDRLIRSLDEARAESKMSKAELALRIGATPEIVRRLFTTTSPNPTISTLVKVALACGMRLELVPNITERKSRSSSKLPTMRHVATLRGRRDLNSTAKSRTAP